MHKKITTLIIALGVYSLIAQPIKKGQEPGCRNFFQIRDSYKLAETSPVKDTNANKNIKDGEDNDGALVRFKRWENFWENRIDSAGEFPEPWLNWKELGKYQGLHSYNKTNVTTANWKNIGPYLNTGSSLMGIGRVNCIQFDPIDPGIIWIGTPAGGLWKSTDKGTTWKVNEALDKFPGIGVSDIAIDPHDPKTMYLAVGDADGVFFFDLVSNSTGILKSSNGGLSWTQTTLNLDQAQQTIISKIIISPQNSDVLIASGDAIWRSANAGATWTKVNTSTFRDIKFKPGSGSVVYAGHYNDDGISALVYKSTDAGLTWVPKPIGFASSDIGRISLGVSAADPGVIYALNSSLSTSSFHSLYRSANSGETWQLACGVNNVAFGTTNQAWLNQAMTISPDNANLVFIGELDMNKSIDGGTTWTPMNGPHVDIHALEVSPHDPNILLCGNDGGIAMSTDKGLSWTNISSGGLAITQINRMSCSATDPDFIIYGAQDNGTNLINKGTSSNIFGGDGMNCLIDYSNDSIIYGSYQFGELMRFKKNDLGSVMSDRGITPGAVAKSIWITPFVIHPGNPKILYAAYDDVLKTSDRGNTWQRISNNLTGGENLKFIAVAPSDGDVIYAGTSRIFPTANRNGKLFKTSNGGQSWTNVTKILPVNLANISSVAIHPNNPLIACVSISGYISGKKVYKTIDGGITWINISGTLPNVPANCLVYEKNDLHGLYLGTDFGVFYINDNLVNWIPFNHGMPNALVSDLHIQYSTSKLRAATFGRGIWETDLSTVTTFIEPGTPSNLVKIYPNPFNSFAILDINANLILKNAEFRIYDILGNLVITIFDINSGETKIEKGNLSSGIYTYLLSDENGLISKGKMLIQ